MGVCSDGDVVTIVLCDMDGPITAFDTAFFDRCGEHGWYMDVDGLEYQQHRFATDHVIDPEHRKAARKMVDAPGWFWNLQPTSGAIDGLHALAEKADVWLCTKPLESSPTCRDEKAAWVEKWLGAEWLRRLIITPHKGLVRGDVLLDDAPNPDWFEDATWTPVIYTASWNGIDTKWDGLPRWQWGDDIGTLIEYGNLRNGVLDAHAWARLQP